MYKTTQPIRSLANGGITLGVDQYVTPGGFTPELWARLLADGVIAEVTPQQAPEFPHVGDVINATAGAIKLATAEGVNLHEVNGTGANGRITLADVRGAIKND